MYYTDDDVILSGMGEGDIKPIKLSAGQWYQPDDFDATFTNAIKQGSGFIYSNSNYMVWGGLSTFSEFGGAGGSNQPLPVELVSFTGLCDEGIINLTWQTASEFNSENWQLLTTLPSAGTSNELITYRSKQNRRKQLLPFAPSGYRRNRETIRSNQHFVFGSYNWILLKLPESIWFCFPSDCE